LRALAELTGEPRFDVALLIALRDAVEHRLGKIDEAVRDYEQEYGMSFEQFQDRGQDEKFPDPFSYKTELAMEADHQASVFDHPDLAGVPAVSDCVGSPSPYTFSTATNPPKNIQPSTLARNPRNPTLYTKGRDVAATMSATKVPARAPMTAKAYPLLKPFDLL
jgi:hypothetical protein